LFGRWLGTAYALVGTTLGASGVFLSARAGLSDLAERAGSQAGGIAAGFRTNAFIYLVQLRLVPLFPFTLVNIAAALGGLSLRIYVLATLVGILPSVFIYASLGDLLLDPALQDRLPQLATTAEIPDPAAWACGTGPAATVRRPGPAPLGR